MKFESLKELENFLNSKASKSIKPEKYRLTSTKKSSNFILHIAEFNLSQENILKSGKLESFIRNILKKVFTKETEVVEVTLVSDSWN